VKQSSWHVVIVNYKTAELARRAAGAARRAAPGARIVVVDAASGEQNDELFRSDPDCEYLPLADNRGYGAALNAGARDARADYLLLLNADTQVGASVLTRFESLFEAMPGLGLVAPRLLSDDGSAQPSCRRFPTHGTLLWSRGSPIRWLKSASKRAYRVPEPNSFTLTDVVAGACLAVRLELWRELGGMDEGFFLYAEDTDLCRRAKQAGWLVGYDPSVTALHAWGASRRHDPGRSRRLHAQSLSHYFRKHYPDRPWANRVLSCMLWINARLRL
jgi:N-acetylglucosaminyl-diphospho-decaprenol L-rhamnosyltransferase